MKTRAEMKQQAKYLVGNHYKFLVLICLLLVIAENGSLVTYYQDTIDYANMWTNASAFVDELPTGMVIIGMLIKVFLANPLLVGCYGALDNLDDTHNASYVLDALKAENYWRNVTAMLWRDIIVILFAMLFIIPGIIMNYRYYFLPLVLARHPEMSTQEALDLAKQYSNDRKFDFFIFDLSFLLWMIVGALTFGLGGIFYVNPYYYMTRTIYFHEVDCELDLTSEVNRY